VNGPTVHVVAGVVSDAAGRILLTQRPAGKHLAGLWEFPGGKCEPAELPQAALRRELHEELGIETGALEPLIAVPWRYAEKSIYLDVFRVLAHTGEPHGREGQALRWVAVADIASLEMPPADRPVIAALRLPPRYAITPEPGDDSAAFLSTFERVLAAGAKFIQLRSKRLPDAALRTLAARARDLAVQAGACLLLNGHVDLVVDLALDGVHLPAAELMRCASRPLPKDRWVGASCHDENELAQASTIGVDFAVLGSVQPTPSHPDAAALGWERFAALRARAPFPVYALGGLRPTDLAAAKSAGAQGVAGISGFWPGRLGKL
jgi:8-oxo-dGTP diphosphatase